MQYIHIFVVALVKAKVVDKGKKLVIISYWIYNQTYTKITFYNILDEMFMSQQLHYVDW